VFHAGVETKLLGLTIPDARHEEVLEITGGWWRWSQKDTTAVIEPK
jgi:hypothetical protein